MKVPLEHGPSRMRFFFVDNEAALIAVVGDQPPRNQLFFLMFGNVQWKRCFFLEETVVEETNAFLCSFPKVGMS